MLDAERAEVEALAAQWRLSMNDVMRRAVREAFEREVHQLLLRVRAREFADEPDAAVELRDRFLARQQELDPGG